MRCTNPERAGDGEPTCPLIAAIDGANCCVLREGHTSPHENYFGQRYDDVPWVTREEFGKISRTWYFLGLGRYTDS